MSHPAEAFPVAPERPPFGGVSPDGLAGAIAEAALFHVKQGWEACVTGLHEGVVLGGREEGQQEGRWFFGHGTTPGLTYGTGNMREKEGGPGDGGRCFT
ncbi:hypothetical protein GCM10018952_14900 [Streptosporangium vulgare]